MKTRLRILLGSFLFWLLSWGCKSDERPGAPQPSRQEPAEPENHSASVDPAAPPSIILIVVDTLRADHLGLAGYEDRPTSPNLDALAEHAFVFDNAYASAPWTRTSLASLFTSKHPMEHLVLAEGEEHENRLDERFVTLAEYFDGLAYDTAAFTANPHYAFGLEQGIAHNHRRFGLIASNLFRDAGGWLRQHLSAPIRRPYFLLVHSIDPHDRYRHHEQFPWAPRDSNLREVSHLFPADSGEGVGESCDMSRARKLSPSELAEMIACYDQEIAYTDNELGHFLSMLKKSGELQKSIVIFTADHGEEFLDHGGYWHGCTLYDELVKVPLVVWVPWLEGRRIRETVGLVDLFPTLVDLVDPKSSLKSELSGQSLLPLLRGERFTEGPIFLATEFRGPVRYGVISGKHKLSVDATGRRELFDLEVDPAEERNLAEAPTRQSRRRKMEALLRSIGSPQWRARIDSSRGQGR